MALAKTLLNLVILIFLIGLCTTDESVVETGENSDSFPTVVPEVKKLVPDDVEVVPASVNNTDFHVTHQEGSDDDDGVVVEAVPVETIHTTDEQSGKNDKYVNPDYDSANYDSLHSRFAPPEDELNRYRGQPYMITKERLQTIRDEFMYWYFDLGGRDGNGDHQNNIHSSTPQVHKNFNFQLPFFGFRFNYTRLSMNGYLEFSDPPEQYVYPLTFPVKEWPKKKDPAFIGIFYSKCRIGKLHPEDIDKRKPGVYFRLERDLPTRIDKFGVEFRERLMWDIREGIVGAKTFVPKHAIVATWKNMSFAGGIDSALYVTNTFQLILATDEVYTYAIFNYLDLQWTSHTEARGDTTTGENGISAYVGFNAGNGTQSYEYQPYSQQSVIRDLTGRGWGNGFKGRHIFRIDEKIMLGTCNKDLSLTNLPLVFAPESGNMLGGTVVNITGPCFDKDDKVVCKFDTVDVVGTVIDRNRAVCIQPMLYAEGYVPLDVRVGQNKYNWKGKYFIETPATATEGIVFDGEAVHQKYPAEIKITWDRFNLTTCEGAGVKIALWGYKESTVHPEFKYIDMIEENAGNTGIYIISPSNFRTRDNKQLSELQFGFLQINVTCPRQEYDIPYINPVLWSKPIPLAWYFAPQWEKKFGKRWAEKLCDKWLMNDRFLRNFAHEIPECPCKLEQAVNDKGRFLPDFDCDKDINRDCIYNDGAVHCVRSGSPSIEGSEQQCCYDKNFYLMLSYDQMWGSKPHRIHNLGYLPWNEANKVPTLSTWYHDVIPFYQCCLWQDEQAIGCETYRFEHRPTQDCVGYQGPAVATVFGDPHVVTFDGLQYTFNGMGEFVLARVNTPKLKLDVQGRFEQVPVNRYGEVKATQLTAIAARGNHSATIEVRLRPKDAQWRYRLDVLADGKKVYFDRKSLKMQHFSGVTVYTPTYILNQSEVVIMFDSGAGVEVIENEGYMATRVYLPWKFINTTKGLMGNWSFDITDDFTTPDGTFSAVTNIVNFQSAHEDFAIKWLIEDNDDKLKGGALFKREFGKTSSNYANRSFVPEFRSSPEEILPSNRSHDINDAHSLCHDVYQCQYDYALTLNRDMAHFTKNYFNSYTTIQSQAAEPVISCGVLETPRFGHKTTFLFVPDTTVSFECNENFHLVGDKRRKCLSNGRWDVPEYGYTECLRRVEYESINAGAAVGIVAAVLLPLIFCVCVIAYCILKNNKEDRSTAWQFAATRSRSSSRLRMNDDEMRPVSPLKSDLSSGLTASADSDLGSNNKKRRTYDKVYRTHEPLEGKPNIEFEDKKWDLDEDYLNSLTSSPASSDTKPVANTAARLPAPFRIDSDSDYATVDDVLETPSSSPTTKLPYSEKDYAKVNKKPKKSLDRPVSTYSTKITDV